MSNAKSTQSYDTIRNPSRSVSRSAKNSRRRSETYRFDHAALDYEGAPRPDEDFADYVSHKAVRGEVIG